MRSTLIGPDFVVSEANKGNPTSISPLFAEAAAGTMGVRGVSRLLPLAALVLPAAGVRSPAQAVVGEPDDLVDSSYTVSWMVK